MVEKDANEDAHGGGSEGISHHFDKDVLLAQAASVYIHPQISTVTRILGALPLPLSLVGKPTPSPILR